jgi:hypothetical protein
LFVAPRAAAPKRNTVEIHGDIRIIGCVMVSRVFGVL